MLISHQLVFIQFVPNINSKKYKIIFVVARCAVLSCHKILWQLQECGLFKFSELIIIVCMQW